MMPDLHLVDPAPLVPVLLEHAARSAVLLTAAFALTAALKSRPASVRHAIWVSTIAVVTLLPVGSRLLPHWEVLPARLAATVQTIGSGIGIERPAEVTTRAPVRPEPRTLADLPSTFREPVTSDEPVAAQTDTPVAWTAARAARSLAAQASDVTAAQWLVLLWLVGIAWNFVRQARSAVQIRRIIRNGDRPSDALLRLARRAADRLQLQRAVDIRLSVFVPMPATWGGRDPAILLPAEARSWDADRLWHVLLHELAHVARRDQPVQSVVRAVCGIFWFNPLLWLAFRALRAESEIACDDLVVLSGSTASRYASHLVEVARSVRDPSVRLPAAALAMAHPSRLEDRVRYILDPGTPRKPMKSSLALLSLSAALLIALPVAAASPQVAPPAPAKPPAPPAPVVAPAPAPIVEPASGPVVVPAPAPVVEPAKGPVVVPAPAPAPEPVAVPAPPPAPEPALGPSRVAVPAPAPLVAPADTIRNRARVVAAFIEALQDSDPELRRHAASALGEMEAAEAIAPLKRVLAGDQDPEVRKAALYALGEIDSDEALPAIADGYRTETDPEMRRHMLWALAEADDPSALPAVRAALDDPDPEVRKTALVALTEIGTADAVPALVRAMQDPEPENQRMAVFALAEVMESGEAGEAAVGALVQASRSGDPETRQAAIIALSESDSEAAVPALVAATKDAEPDVRRHAIFALAEMDSPDAMPALRAAARDADPEVRRFALHALAEREDAASIDVMRDALDDADPEIRREALMVLSDSGDPGAVSAMGQALRDEDPEVRRMAVWGLAESDGGSAAVDLLASVLDRDSDPEVRRDAAFALGELGGDKAVDALTRALKDQDPDVRKAAIMALTEAAEDN